MKFEEWYKSTYKHTAFLDEKGEIAISPEMRRCWNAAIDECVKVIENNQCEADGYHACSHQDVFANKIKELKS